MPKWQSLELLYSQKLISRAYYGTKTVTSIINFLKIPQIGACSKIWVAEKFLNWRTVCYDQNKEKCKLWIWFLLEKNWWISEDYFSYFSVLPTLLTLFLNMHSNWYNLFTKKDVNIQNLRLHLGFIDSFNLKLER